MNKNDLFESKVALSDIKTYFPDYDGAPGNATAGRDYFKTCFLSVSQNRLMTERKVYIHTTTATDTAMLRPVMSAVEKCVSSPSTASPPSRIAAARPDLKPFRVLSQTFLPLAPCDRTGELC
jgi:hypothetical protein